MYRKTLRPRISEKRPEIRAVVYRSDGSVIIRRSIQETCIDRGIAHRARGGPLLLSKVYPSDFQTRHHPPSSSFKMPSTTSKFTCPTQSASFAISDRNSSISLLAMAVPKPSLSISWLSEEGDAEIIPITSPRLLMTGPPLLPPLILALIRYVLKGVGYGFSDAAMSPVVE